MSPFASTSLQRSIVTLGVVFSVLTVGTWLSVKIATDYLLYQEATSTARDWAQYVTDGVADLEYIAAGEQPSAASMAFFQGARKAGKVFRYEIFNSEGYSQLLANRDAIALVNLAEFSPEAAQSVRLGQAVVDVKEGGSADLPSFFGQAYVPVVINGQAIAVVAAYVDQTEARDRFHDTFLIAALSLCLLIGLSYLVPAIGWYLRSKEKLESDQRIRYLAHHDALTDLANRAQLVEKMGDSLAPLPLRGGGFAVHFIDLDRFKVVNDTWGHDGGDFLLKAVAERLRGVIGAYDVAARLGGDEFVVVQSGACDTQQAAAFAERIISALIAPVRFGEQEILATVSLGVALAPRDGDTPERLLKCSDLALYKAKDDGRNCARFFEPEMDAEMQARIELERTIRDAVLHDRFELHYQPLFQMSDRRLIGFEALIRLRTEDGKLIPPLVFIPVAEDMRLIDKIGAWVLREACHTAATWPAELTVAVNLSPAQFLAGSISTVVAAALVEAGLAANRLELEITESLILANTEANMAELRTLKAMGVAIVMDDFGTGYSSLSYLWRFPFDKIKIDRSFMQGFEGSDRHAETVVKTIIALGRELHMRVTIEGIETAEQVTFLEGADGDQAQGFYFGRPLPAAEIAGKILANFQQQQLGTLHADTKLRLVT